MYELPQPVPRAYVATHVRFEPTPARALATLQTLASEQRYLQFRSDIFNLFNHSNFDNPNVTLTSPMFGKITSAGVQDARASSRQIQFALRLAF